MSADTLPPIPPNIGQILGPQLIGSIVNFTLFGVLLVQTYVYHVSFPRDNPGIKYLVYFVFLFELAQTIMNAVDIYEWFGAGFGNLIIASDPRLSYLYTPIMDGLMGMIVQVFMCYRIFIINRDVWYIPAFTGLLAVVQAIAACVAGGKAHQSSSVSSARAHQIKVLEYLWLIGSAVADIIIAATLSTLLLRARNKKHRQTSDVVSKIVRLTIETNTVTTIIAIISVGLMVGLPGQTYFICPTMFLGKLYSNTLLLTLNNRAFVNKPAQIATNMTGSVHAQSTIPFGGGLALSSVEHKPSGAQLNVFRTTVTESHMEGGHIPLNDKTPSPWNA